MCSRVCCYCFTASAEIPSSTFALPSFSRVTQSSHALLVNLWLDCPLCSASDRRDSRDRSVDPAVHQCDEGSPALAETGDAHHSPRVGIEAADGGDRAPSAAAADEGTKREADAAATRADGDAGPSTVAGSAHEAPSPGVDLVHVSGATSPATLAMATHSDADAVLPLVGTVEREASMGPVVEREPSPPARHSPVPEADLFDEIMNDDEPVGSLFSRTAPPTDVAAAPAAVDRTDSEVVDAPVRSRSAASSPSADVERSRDTGEVGAAVLCSIATLVPSSLQLCYLASWLVRGCELLSFLVIELLRY